MKISELYMQPHKKGHSRQVEKATLIAGMGMEGDCHLGAARQISLWGAGAKARARDMEYRGLCMRQFYANIIIDGLEESAARAGDRLCIGGVAIRITQAGKRCYPEECALPSERIACPLQSVLYGVVERGGGLSVGIPVLCKPGSTDPG